MAFLKAVLKDVARLEQAIKDNKADSVTIDELRLAYVNLAGAVEQCQTALRLGAKASDNDRVLLKYATDQLAGLRKVIRTQKLLKWLGWGAAAFLGYLAASR